MNHSLQTWKDQFLSLKQKYGYDVCIHKTHSYGSFIDYYDAKVCIPYNPSHQIYLTQATQCIQDIVSPNFLCCSLDTQKLNLTLYLIVKSWFGFSFHKRFHTGNPDFDKKFTIKCSDLSVATNLFSDPYVQNLFLSHVRMINVTSQDKNTRVVFKNLESKLYTTHELQHFIDDFRYLLNKLDIPL